MFCYLNASHQNGIFHNGDKIVYKIAFNFILFWIREKGDNKYSLSYWITSASAGNLFALNFFVKLCD